MRIPETEKMALTGEPDATERRTSGSVGGCRKSTRDGNSSASYPIAPPLQARRPTLRPTPHFNENWYHHEGRPGPRQKKPLQTSIWPGWSRWHPGGLRAGPEGKRRVPALHASAWAI